MILSERKGEFDKMTTDNTKNLKKQVAPYERATTKESVWQIINTLVPFFALWYLAYLSLSVSYWLALVPIVVAAGFLVRTFIIFHDCTHYSFFKSRRANKIVGMITGVLTLFPYEQWGHDHAIHHATSGNLDKRGTGDIWTLTVDEYLASSFKQLHLIVLPSSQTIRKDKKLSSREGHFALRVENYHLTLDWLKKNGIEVLEKYNSVSGFAQIFCADPDGNLIELNVDRKEIE